MIHHFGGPGFLLVTAFAGIMELFSKKHRKSSATLQAEAEIRQKEKVNAARKMVADHADCTAEVFDITVRHFPERQYLRDIKVGDKVDIYRNDEIYEIWSKGKKICNLKLPDTSRLPYIFDHNVRKHAFLGGIDPDECLYNFTNATIIVFYRLRGVAPSRVKLEI